MKQFQIPSNPPKTSKTIRFPNDTIESIKQITESHACTFSAFVIAAVRAALEAESEPAEKGLHQKSRKTAGKHDC